MDQLSPSEALPALYRAVLNGVAELELLGDRREAGRVRSEAIRIYSRSWDAKGRQRLQVVLKRTERALADSRDPRRRRVRSTAATTT